MDLVIVEFKASGDRSDECVAALESLTEYLVSKQPAFRGTTIVVDTADGTVMNLMQWDSAADFVAFRDANQDVIGPALGQFGPTPRFTTIAATLE